MVNDIPSDLSRLSLDQLIYSNNNFNVVLINKTEQKFYDDLNMALVFLKAIYYTKNIKTSLTIVHCLKNVYYLVGVSFVLRALTRTMFKKSSVFIKPFGSYGVIECYSLKFQVRKLQRSISLPKSKKIILIYMKQLLLCFWHIFYIFFRFSNICETTLAIRMNLRLQNIYSTCDGLKYLDTLLAEQRGYGLTLKYCDRKIIH